MIFDDFEHGTCAYMQWKPISSRDTKQNNKLAKNWGSWHLGKSVFNCIVQTQRFWGEREPF